MCAKPALTSLVPAPRLAPYVAVAGTGQPLEDFYAWAQDVALALFADISLLEVALRSAMARELTVTFGNQWYARANLFDDDAQKSIANTWRHNDLGALVTKGVPLDTVEGKLVAASMFGFWTQLLGKGSYAGSHPFRQRRIYDALLWHPALRKAFPHASGREQVQRAANNVRATRNRIAHHEHVVWGIPLPGKKSKAGAKTRLTVTQAHQTVLDLAGFISADTATWIDNASNVASLIAACPVSTTPLHL